MSQSHWGDERIVKYAYADPPYVGQAKLYRDHPDYAGEVDHATLVDRLEQEFADGWALSLSVPSLPLVLPICPPLGPDLRLCAWMRGQVPRPPARIMWSWEPLLVRTASWRRRHDGDFVRDSLLAHEPSGFLGNTITGQKPVTFCHWLFALLGLEPDDELVDLFPGSGSVGQTWERWRAQTRLIV